MDVILRDILVFLQSGNIWRHVRDVIDVSLVAFFLYRLFLLVRGTEAVQLMFGVLLLALIGLLATLLDLRLLSWIFRNAAPAVLIGIIVLFQPEIRRALDQFGRIGFIGRPLAHYNLQIFNRMVDEVIRATTKLTQRFTGALIVFEKETGLENYANSGIRINGELTAEFLEAIFFPNSPLHDGAVIVRGNQILAAGCEEDRFRSEEHTSELQSHLNLVCRLLLEKKKSPISPKKTVQKIDTSDEHRIYDHASMSKSRAKRSLSTRGSDSLQYGTPELPPSIADTRN